MRARGTSSLAVVCFLLAACTSASTSPSRVTSEGAAPPAPAPQRTLIMAADRLPVDFASKGIVGGLGSTSGTSENIPQTIFNATLALADERGRPMP